MKGARAVLDVVAMVLASNVTLTMWRHGGISGRVVDELNEPVVGIPVRALRVILAAGVPHVAPGPIGTTDDRGMYRIGSVPAGRYLVMVPSVQSSAPASTSARTDILDEPYTLEPSAPVPTVVLTLTDRHSSLSGAFQDATGRATSAITVLVFPTNSAWWGETSRRVRVQRPGTDGKYSFVDLPPGDYVLAAVIDMEPDAWRDPAFLRSLVVGGVQVTIGEGEQKTQDLRIGRATISGLEDNQLAESGHVVIVVLSHEVREINEAHGSSQPGVSR